MIDIKTLTEYTRFLNLKQVCIISGVNYNTVKDRIRTFRLKKHGDLSEEEAIRLARGFKKIGIQSPLLKIKN